MSANAFAYMRCSGQGQIDGDTWDRQREAIERYSKASGYDVTQQFFDEGVSGKTEFEGRNGLSSCMAECQLQNVHTVIVESADRLARDLIISELIISEFQKIGVTVISASGGVNLTEGDSSNPTSKLIRQILAAFAEFERSSIVNKLRVARQRVKSKTGRCEGQKPYGHTPEESRTLARIRAYRDERFTCAQIAERLTTEGITARSGAPWHASTIAKILARTAQTQHFAKVAQFIEGDGSTLGRRQ